MPPASATAYDNSGVCLHISLRVDATVRFREISGSCIQRTSSGTAPASTTACASSVKKTKNSSLEQSN